MNGEFKNTGGNWKAVFAIFFLLFFGTLFLSLGDGKLAEPASAGSISEFLYLPLLSNGTAPQCRFGVNVIQNPDNVQLEKLRLGWYLNYNTVRYPEFDNQAKFVPVIRLSQTGPNAQDFSYVPSGSSLLDVIAANPGADWLIGNEPDRRDFQDDMEPHVYAAAYAELYDIIKTADPQARVFAGAIVQPTPLRLQYLDMVLDSFSAQNGGAKMPVDGWSIHNFILNEVSCDYDPGNCWGAGIPPGINADVGEVLDVQDNDNMDLFKVRIENFRQWMYDRGYAGLPLTVSEYGILMPDWLGFDNNRVNTFMNATFDYMETAVDPVLGDPNDNDKLVQTWSWFSTGAVGDEFNGYLFEGTAGNYPWALSVMGQNYANYTAGLTKQIDLYPSSFTFSPAMSTAPANITLTAIVANSGTNVFPESFVVRFYNGDPDAGGIQLGSDQIVSLEGCGHNKTVTHLWENVSSGTYQVYVVVDAGNAFIESNEDNNSKTLSLTVGN
ncbi:MAG: hypothetical protein H6652_15265 [Ardenticatenaceae bacterium]|nr:hypothetical protein [Ardenticatenaceae bacterium]MCB8946923.1 hypothetical protein [Ardenticatenaceae bacterium]